MRKAAEERWERERGAEIRRVQQDMVDAEEQAVLKAREDYYRKRLAERPKLPPTPKPPPEPEPPPVEKSKYRKPDRSAWKRKAFPGETKRGAWWAEELLSLISESKAFSPCDRPMYTVDDRIIEAAESWHDQLHVDVRDMEWNGYEWAII